MIAVPGWNGTCDDSFGHGDNNLLNVMRSVNFFDIDCFDYDSHNTPLKTSAQQLLARLVALQNDGYRQVAFVTHSTGGVLVLELLQSEMMSGNGTALRTGPDQSILFKKDGIKLVGVFAFAIPINGVRDHICLAAGLGNVVGATGEVVPTICGNSAYLQGLKDEFVKFNGLYAAVPANQRPALGFDFSLNIYQGQGEDWVVNPIDTNDPWVPASAAPPHLANTLEGHTHIVADNQIEFPTFSGEVMQDRSLLTFSLNPRTDEYFKPTLPATITLDQVQRAIVGGVVDFASIKNLFAAAAPQVSDFVVMLLNARFTRAPDFDEFAVSSFDGLLVQRKSTQDDAAFVAYGDDLLADVDRGFVAPNQSDPLSFGGQSKAAARELAQTLTDLFTTARSLVEQDSSLAVNLRDDGGSLDAFDARLGRVVPRLLSTPDIATQNAAVNLITLISNQSSPKALEASGLVGALAQFSVQNYATMTMERKATLGDAFKALSARSPSLSDQVVTQFNQEVPWLGRQAPLWAPLLNDQQMRVFIERAQPQDQSDTTLKFLSGVGANGGRYFVSADTAKLATDKLGQFQQLVVVPISRMPRSGINGLPDNSMTLLNPE